MIKDAKDMNYGEKQLRIERLSYKFYDIKTTPSILLSDEIKYTEPDDYILNAIKQLKTLELRRHKLEDQYHATLSEQLRQMKRVFEYEQEQIAAEHKREEKPHKFDPMNKFAGRGSNEKYEQQMADLKRSQMARKKEIDSATFAELDACNRELRTVFLDAVRHLYR